MFCYTVDYYYFKFQLHKLMFSVLFHLLFVISMSLKQSERILRESLYDFKDSQKKLKSLGRLHGNLVFCLQELGSFGALQVSWHCFVRYIDNEISLSLFVGFTLIWNGLFLQLVGSIFFSFFFRGVAWELL